MWSYPRTVASKMVTEENLELEESTGITEGSTRKHRFNKLTQPDLHRY